MITANSPATQTNSLNGTRFGTIEFETEDVLTFHEGIIGFAEMRTFLILEHKPGSPFRWLQSIEEPAMAFLLADPLAYVADYDPNISRGIIDSLELDQSTPYLLLTTASIPGGNAENMTLNLAAPILVNVNSRVGKQVVLDDGAYNIRHRVFSQPETQAA